jgi:sugar lactone lactonase YvrE
LYVADSANHRIQKFSNNDTLITEWEVRGTSNNQFLSPFGITVDSFARVFVSAAVDHKVKIFDGWGDFKNSFAFPGSPDEESDWPCGLAIDSAQKV